MSETVMFDSQQHNNANSIQSSHNTSKIASFDKIDTKSELLNNTNNNKASTLMTNSIKTDNNSNTNSTIATNNNNTSNSNSKRPAKIVGNYKLGRTLGSGSMGKVKLATHLVTGHSYAVKIIPYEDTEQDEHKKDKSRTKRIEREIMLLSLLDHPNIVKLVDHLILNNYYYLIFEFVSGGQLLDYIISHGRLSEKQARLLTRQIMSAVYYCHLNSVVHRDLKIENILVTEDGKIKVIDFGLSNMYSTNSQLNTFCGSLYFAAPELLSAREYIGPEVDVWSLGVIVYVLVTGRVPFDDNNMPALHAKIKKGHVSYPMWLSKECKSMLMQMLQTDPNQRASMDELMKCAWINKGYSSFVDVHYPNREPLNLPLDKNVINAMGVEFQFGSTEQIEQKLNKLVGDVFSENNKQALKKKNSSLATLNTHANNHTKIKDLRKLMFKNKKHNEEIYPLISIYYLVREKMHKNGLLFKNSETTQETDKTESSKNISNHSEENSQTLRFDTSVNNNSNNKTNNKKPTLMKRLSQSGLKNTNKLFHRWSMINDENNNNKNNSKRLSSTAPKSMKRRWSKLVFNNKKANASSHSNDKKSEETSLNANSNKELSSNQNLTPSTPKEHSSSMENQTSESSNNTEIKQNKNKIKWNSMSLKGFFSAATTSTKNKKTIEQNLLNALKVMGIKYTVTEDGHLECYVYNANNIQSSIDDANNNNNKENKSNKSNNKDKLETISELDLDNTKNNNSNSNSNETFSRNNNHKPIMVFQIMLVKIKLLKLYGVKFRRLEGGPWEYKSMCSLILSKLKL